MPKKNSEIKKGRKTDKEQMELHQKPKAPYKDYISPSSLYKLRCPRCLWLLYNHNFQLPTNLSLQQRLSRLQEAFFHGKYTKDVNPSLKEGTIQMLKGRKKSKNIIINDEVSKWYFMGELDFIVNYTDNTHGILDGKVSMKNDLVSLGIDYLPQLHAYTYMLENPLVDEKIKISDLGLIRWKISGTSVSQPWGFTVETDYIKIERNDEKFLKLMETFINIVEGNFPDSSSDCIECNWLKEINFQY